MNPLLSRPGSQYVVRVAPPKRKHVRVPYVRNQLLCARCGRTWEPQPALLKKGLLPVKCPHCYSRRWNVPRQRRPDNKEGVDA